MLNESQPGTRHPAPRPVPGSTNRGGPDTCPACGGSGWKSIFKDGRSSVIVCDCRRSRTGMQSIGEILGTSKAIEAVLTPHDKQIRAILQGHVGRENAIRSAELAALVFDGAGDPKRKEEFRRNVTQSIERLRTFARLPIAATKEPPYGYFLAETEAEWGEMHERYMRELVRIARLARLFRPQADIVQRLRGQMELQESGARSQESA